MLGDATRLADVSPALGKYEHRLLFSLPVTKQSKCPLVQPVSSTVQLHRSGIELKTAKLHTVSITNFDVLLTVHLGIILVTDQLNAKILVL